MATRKKGLGRGLDALLGADLGALDSVGKPGNPDEPLRLPLDCLHPGEYQPRRQMDDAALAALAESVQAQGIMQPLLVRPLLELGPGQYEIIAGERRFRAAQLAGLKDVPVLIRRVDDRSAAIMALVENIQREDLNPLEEAQGIQRLIDDFDFTHEQAAQAVGRSRSATSNLLRLLRLAEGVQTLLQAGTIDMGHARALLALESAQQLMLASEIAQKKLSVRETEKKVAQLLASNDDRASAITDRKNKPKPDNDGDRLRLEQSLSDHLATRVRIRPARKGGQLMIEFSDWEHLNALLRRQGLGTVLDN